MYIQISFSPFENIRCIYFVAAHKLILNVSKIRLRLICARASYLYRLFSKGGLCKYTAHLRCRLTKNSPRRTTSTPAGVFCTLLASASSISKGLRQMVFQYRHGWRWFHAAACLPCKHVGKKYTRMYIFYRACG